MQISEAVSGATPCGTPAKKLGSEQPPTAGLAALHMQFRLERAPAQWAGAVRARVPPWLWRSLAVSGYSSLERGSPEPEAVPFVSGKCLRLAFGGCMTTSSWSAARTERVPKPCGAQLTLPFQPQAPRRRSLAVSCPGPRGPRRTDKEPKALEPE